MKVRIENEMKFTQQSFDSSYTLAQVSEFLTNYGYIITEQYEEIHYDHYYDTTDRILLKNDYSARIRDCGYEKVMMIKIPITKENGIVSRKLIVSVCDDCDELQSFVSTYFQENIVLNEAVTLKVTRDNVVFKSDRAFILSVDKFTLDGEGCEEYVTEIEIESGVDDRIDEFELEKLVSFITADLGFRQTNESKYSRALK